MWFRTDKMPWQIRFKGKRKWSCVAGGREGEGQAGVPVHIVRDMIDMSLSNGVSDFISISLSILHGTPQYTCHGRFYLRAIRTV
jgi:hypothetical protein